MRPALLCTLLVAVAACGAAEDAPVPPSDTTPSIPPAPTSGIWPDAGPVDFARELPYDLTGDGTPETIRASARGPRYDSLDVALTITGAARDTLWHEAWPSLLYFKYEPLEGKADSTVMRIVRDHVDSLVHESRISPSGLPRRLAQGGSVDESMREAARYHLAEIDWRGSADLTPADATPPDAHSRIRSDLVSNDRVNVVLEELRDRPVFWYYAGGEATYAIAWSGREHAFVRIFSCC